MLVTEDAQGIFWPGRLARHAHWAVVEMPLTLHGAGNG
jgi:hypothetical protein